MFVLIVALLGASVAILPAVAGSETAPASIEAVNSGPYGFSWVPPQVTIAPGGVVTFSNPTEVKHGIEWRSAVKPTCTSGVPVGTTPESSGSKWSGTCTFTQPGSYVFYCTVHGASMAGTVHVGGETTTTTATTTPTTPSGTTTTNPSGGPGSNTPGGAGSSASPPPGAAAIVALLRKQHGKVVHGAVDIPGRDAGGRLEVDLLASRASIAGAGAAAPARVGRIVRTSLHAGKLSFSVPLNARARGALARHRHLALTVKIVLTPLHGSPSSTTRSIVLRP